MYVTKGGRDPALHAISSYFVCTGQCPVSAPTIVSSSSSENVVCTVVTQGILRYICNNDNIIVWSSSVISGTIAVAATSATGPIPIQNATGVTLVENDNNNAMCLNSTLTFTGTVADLEQLNGAVLNCADGADASLTDDVTIVIPGENNVDVHENNIHCVFVRNEQKIGQIFLHHVKYCL